MDHTNQIRLTLENMAFQASSRHKLVDEHPVFIFTAVSNEFNEVGVPQLPEEDDLRLESHTHTHTRRARGSGNRGIQSKLH